MNNESVEDLRAEITRLAKSFVDGLPPMTVDILADWVLTGAKIKKGRRPHLKKLIIDAINEYEEWRDEILENKGKE